MTTFSPREIVSELDRFIVGQSAAKRAVAIALRNRWRRQQLEEAVREEVQPKNILMIGPTGVGKTEISRRLSKLAQAPFIKVEATRFTEVGYVGRDVEQIIRDLLEIAIAMEKEKKRKEVKAKAQLLAEERVLNALVGAKASIATKESFRKRLRNGDLDDNEIEVDVKDSNPMPNFEIPGIGEIRCPPVSVCHHVSITGHLSLPTTVEYQLQASGLIGSPTVPNILKELKSHFSIYEFPSFIKDLKTVGAV